MLETIRNIQMMRWSIGLTVLFIVACAKSCSELQHSMWGRTATAKITSVEPSMYEATDLRIAFRFEDEHGVQHHVKRTMSSEIATPVVGDQVQVIYLSRNPERARLLAERSLRWPFILAAIVGGIVLWSVVTYWRMERGIF